MAQLKELQREVDVRLRRGDSFTTVEDDVIEPSGLSEDSKSALWLYGWAYMEAGRRNYQQRQQTIRRRAGDTPLALGTD